MALYLEDNIKNKLKNATVFYSQVLNNKKISKEDAIAYTLLSKMHHKNSFLETLYSLANVNINKQGINEQNISLSKTERIDYYKEIKEYIEVLLNRYKNDNMQEYDIKNVGIIEIAFLVMNYHPYLTQEFFQLPHEKYRQLTEVLKEKMLLDSKKSPNISTNPHINKSNVQISKYGAENITDYEYRYNPLVGNEQALRKVVKSLLGGNSLIILGDAGVGKTTLVKGLAYNIKMNNVPDFLKNKQIISLPISGIVANTEYVGRLEKHINEIINYAKANRDSIFYIDEIHTIMGAGQSRESTIDISNLLKPYISNKTMQIIGATTNEEFDKTIATNPAFRRRFRTITLNEPTEKEVLQIANHYIPIKEEETEIEWTFNNSFLETLINLTSSKNRKYFETINNPNITIAIIDDIFASALYYEKSCVDKQDVIESIEDNELLATQKKEELLRKLSSDDLYTQAEDSSKPKILSLVPDYKNS